MGRPHRTHPGDRDSRSLLRDEMNCQNHPEVPATAYCRNCGKPVCEQCRRDAFGTVYCEEHAPAPAARAAEPPPGFTAAPPPPFAGPIPTAAPLATGYVYAD